MTDGRSCDRPNWEEIGKIEKEPTPSCDRLRKLGLSTQFYG